jgi:site-specific DNA recombinase
MIAAIYARKSTEQLVSDDQKSIARQIDHARAYAARKGWTVDDAHVYSDDGISGAEFTKRPGFVRLMSVISRRRAPFQALIMAEESRLGREAIETAFALKQLVQAGVRVFFYLEDRERRLDTPTDKIMLNLQTYADELERERTRQRTYDALARKARAGHVTGGVVFGYDNVEVLGPNGRRSHVARHINEHQAAVVRRIFELRTAGIGQVRIARILNEERAVAPRPRGHVRPVAWAPSSVREVLFRELYRGVIVWNRKRKRNQWGQEQHSPKPEGEWMRVAAPELRIVPDTLWFTAHRELEKAREEYDRVTRGGRRRVPGEPGRAIDRDSKYLLVGFARCGVCGSKLCIQSRQKGKRGRLGRAFFYRCTSNLLAGASICSHGQLWPMEDLDQEVLSAVGGEALAPEAIAEALEEARAMYDEDDEPNQVDGFRRELAGIMATQERLAEAIASGAGGVQAIVKRLQAAEQRRAELDACLREAQPTRSRPLWRDIERYVLRSLDDWRTTLLGDVAGARSAFRKLLVGSIVCHPRITASTKALRCEGRIGLAALLAECSANVGVTRGSTADFCTTSFSTEFVRPAA